VTDNLRAVRTRHPSFRRALLEDARVYLRYRGETPKFVTRVDAVREIVRLAWVSDAFFAQGCYRAKAGLQRLGIPVLPRLLHRLAMSSAQVCIGDPVVVEPGVYLPHGQVVVDGFVTIGSGSVLFPWVTIGLVAGEFRGPTVGSEVHVGTGAKVLGPIHVGTGARIGANAVVISDVAAGATVVGVPAHETRQTAVDEASVDLPVAMALTEAEELAAEGRFDAAIAHLTDVNRSQPSSVIERRLVQLRHQWFLAASHPAGHLSWPPVDPGVFADEAGLPEIDADQLTLDTLRSGIVGHGALVVRGLLEPARVGQLASDIHRALAAFDAAADGRADPELAPWYEPFESDPSAAPLPVDDRLWVREGGGVLAAESPRALFDLVDALSATRVLDVLTEHFGERPALSVKKTTLREVQPDTNTSWHQDGAFLGAGIRAVNVWIALSDCGVDAPSLDVVARRLDGIVRPGTDGAIFPWSVSDTAAERAAGDRPIVRPVFQPGDAILFDELNLHRTGAGPGLTRPRLAIEAWFFAPSSYPHDQIPIAV
jgi:serine acetyltransferase